MISHIDHIVLTVQNIDRSIHFYQKLGMTVQTFAHGRKSLHFGNQKINLQELGQETRNNAQIGSGDLCLISDWSLDAIINHLANHQIPIIEGPVKKTGAQGKIDSIYISDPDKNLVEISVYTKV
ncbi:VOC family protein [Fangia hongkongensis]|uniref:VOC family protein n=1 Tax=Fangia hongkongensis TaxID=270495 RepID=UPI00036288F5|nr:VOC family protein [Fangia hongkongensis]MBK2125055.1 VOC family protein [Fangia hongkongensis]